MAHDIAVFGGKHTFAYTGERPGWHQLGQSVPLGMETSEHVIKYGNVDWQYQKAKLFVKQKGGKLVEVPSHKAIIRVNDLKQFGVVGNVYEILPPKDAFDGMDSWLKDGRLTYETVGALKDGAEIFILARLAENFLVAGKDAIEPYVLLRTSYDGSAATTIKKVVTRVVCRNTMTAALGESGQMLRIRHTSSQKQRLAEADKALGLVGKETAAMLERFNELAQMNTSDELIAKVTEIVAPAPLPDTTDRTREARQRERLAFFKLMNSSPTVAYAGGTDNRWGLFNAATEYLDWMEPRRGQNIEKDGLAAAEKRLLYTTDGEAALKRQQVFNLLAVPA